MSMISIGDLARTFILQSQNAAFKAELNTRMEELASGRKADTGQAVGGDFASLAGVERGLALMEAYRISGTEARLMAETMQAALGKVQDLTTEIGPALVAAGTSENPAMLNATADEARRTISVALDTLNVSVSGRRAFAGSATDARPMAGADAILAELRTLTAGETTAVGVMAQLDVWFDTPGGGFETFAYQGSDRPVAAFRIGEETSTELDVRGDAPAIREVLKGLAMGALRSEGVLATDPEQSAELVRAAGEQLMTSQSALTDLRARVGSAEAVIEAVSVENAAVAGALEITRNELIGVDPFDTATRLEAVQHRLETLYTITARLSRLSLSEYLR